MYAFIVRPFGRKRSASGAEVDFDAVERQLIVPALAAAQVPCSTTTAVVEQGNIREDMFQLLVTADLVVADVSIHNANVFYELGIRHALRRGSTFLLRHGGDDIPFDLKTDRYFEYDAADPAASVDALAKALRATVGGDRTDSPVFALLPALAEPDLAALQAVPTAFGESVRLARAHEWAGDLGLLAEECRGLPWESGALPLVGEAQFKLKSFEGARLTWEAVLRGRPTDALANLRLATIYQRLGNLDLSDVAIDRVLRTALVAPRFLAEAHALAGSNAKRRWIDAWRAGDAATRSRRAFQSPFLTKSRQCYETGFKVDINQYYPGLNALALTTVQCALAEACPDDWGGRHASDDEAARALKELTQRRDSLAHAVRLSLEAASERGAEDCWLAIAQADLALLTGERPSRVAHAYREALEQASAFDVDATDAQLGLYRDLGLFREGVEAAAAVVAEMPKPGAVALPRVLLFTGHRMDVPGRNPPRFPASAEGAARSMIRDKVQAEVETAGGPVLGIAGGASGGDILFHEVCEELGVPTTVFLAGPRSDFVAQSVQDSANGAEWVRRLDRLLATHPMRQLGETLDVPSWHPGHGDAFAVWPRNNLWMLHSALAHGAAQVTLIALWNGESGDGPGGTEDMIARARQRGGRTVVLDATKLVT